MTRQLTRLAVVVSLAGLCAAGGCSGSVNTVSDAGAGTSDATASSSGLDAGDGSCPQTKMPIPCSGGDYLLCVCDGHCDYVGTGFGGGCSSSSGSSGGGNPSGGSSSSGGSDASGSSGSGASGSSGSSSVCPDSGPDGSVACANGCFCASGVCSYNQGGCCASVGAGKSGDTCQTDCECQSGWCAGMCATR